MAGRIDLLQKEVKSLEIELSDLRDAYSNMRDKYNKLRKSYELKCEEFKRALKPWQLIHFTVIILCVRLLY